MNVSITLIIRMCFNIFGDLIKSCSNLSFFLWAILLIDILFIILWYLFICLFDLGREAR